jgi:glyoxylase-like metal-dependent hydrolase (beta-lactamase superfamily II)
MLEGAGGNIGVSVGQDGTLIVDDQFMELNEKISAALEELGGAKPKLILNTHFHGDHTGSNPAFGTTGTIIAHDNVRVRLLAEEGFPRSGLPLVTYDDHVTVHFNDDQLQLIHLPNGHTDGDSLVWFKVANVIHMGDQFFNGRFPFVDVGSGGSIDGFIANVHRVIEMVPADIKIIPGHGPLASLSDLKATIETVEKTTKQVRKALKKGTKVEDIAAKLDEDYAAWGTGFIDSSRWVQIIQADAQR